MKSLLQLIHDYQDGEPNSSEAILKRMEPLIRSYSSRIHCMEYEDASQELYLALLKSLPYLNPNFSEGECVTYMKTAVENRYRSLCHYYLSQPPRENISDYTDTLKSPDCFDDTYTDVSAYIHSYPKESMDYKILFLYFYQNKTDSEIARILSVSRQYINRRKKKLLLQYVTEHPN